MGAQCQRTEREAGLLETGPGALACGELLRSLFKLEGECALKSSNHLTERLPKEGKSAWPLSVTRGKFLTFSVNVLKGLMSGWVFTFSSREIPYFHPFWLCRNVLSSNILGIQRAPLYDPNPSFYFHWTNGIMGCDRAWKFPPKVSNWSFQAIKLSAPWIVNSAPLFLLVSAAVLAAYVLVFQTEGGFKRPEKNASQVSVSWSQARTEVKAKGTWGLVLLPTAWRGLTWLALRARQP